MPIYDLICDSCGKIVNDELLFPDDFAGPCPICGFDMRITCFLRGTQFHDGSFKPMYMGNGEWINTTGELERYKAELKMKWPNHEIHFESNTPEKAKQHAEELRHTAWERRKARGIDDNMLREQAEMPTPQKPAGENQ